MVKPHSLIRLSTVGSLGGLFHGMTGKTFVWAISDDGEHKKKGKEIAQQHDAANFMP